MNLSHHPAWWRPLVPRTKTFVPCLLAVVLLAGLGFLYPIASPPQNPQSYKLPATSSAAAVTEHSLLTISTITANVDHCASSYRDIDEKIAFVVKTTASVALSRLPTLLLTSLRCVSDPIFVSDLPQTLGRHAIYDILATISPETKAEHTEFDIYRLQQELLSTEQLPAIARLTVSTTEKGKGNGAAALDRWKWLHMIEQAWSLQTGREWYVFVDDGVYLSMSNLQRLLGKHDWREPWFLSHRARGAKLSKNAQDEGLGSGVIVLSGRLVKDWMTEYSGLAERWDDRVADFGTGGQVLTRVLDEELGVQLADVGTVLQPNALEMMPFGPHTWCREVVSLKGLDSGRMDDVHRVEEKTRRGNEYVGLRFQDIYTLIYRAGFPFYRDDWDNGAASSNEDDLTFALEVSPNDVTKMQGQWEPKDFVDPHKFFGGCEMACIMNEACMQFLFVTTITKEAGEEGKDGEVKSECFMSSVFRLGRKREAESGREDGEEEGREWRRVWKSGWRSDRIERWVEGQGECG